MAFDPVAYGEMLDSALGYRRPMGGARAGAGPAQLPGGAPQMPPSMPGAAAAPSTIDGPVPNQATAAPVAPAAGAGLTPMQPGGQVIGAPPPTAQPGRIQAQPPFKLEYKKGAVGKVKTAGDLVEALKPESQAKYMDWWEQQHGAINERYNQLQQQLGRRPDPKGDLSRKEQFRMLMEFGIELMARAGRGEKGAGGTAFANSYGRARQQKEIDTAEHDTRSALIEKSRGDELKSIGTYGDALKGQSAIDQDAVQMQEARARMKRAGMRDPEIISADQGTYDYDKETQIAKPIVGIDGKPLTNMKVGSRGGSAAGRDSRTAHQKDIEDLVGRGMPEQLAVDIVHRRITDPRKAWQAIYRDRRRQYSSEKEARTEADRITAEQYGDDWQDQGTKPSLNKADPLGLRD